MYEQLTLTQQVLGLMTLQPKSRQADSRFLYFVNIERWFELRQLFEAEACQLYHIDKTPLMKNLLQVGLSAIKTTRCGTKAETECPACDPLFLPMTKELRHA